MDCVEIGPRSAVSNVLQNRFLTISLLDEVGAPLGYTRTRSSVSMRFQEHFRA